MAMKAVYATVNGRLLSQTRSGVRSFYSLDPLGNTRALYDNTQTKTDTFTYTPFGTVATHVGTTPTPFQWNGGSGYYQNSATRVYVRARNYYANLGKWSTQDPIGFDGGDYNLYRYVENRIVTANDPSGLIFCTESVGRFGSGRLGSCNNMPIVGGSGGGTGGGGTGGGGDAYDSPACMAASAAGATKLKCPDNYVKDCNAKTPPSCVYTGCFVLPVPPNGACCGRHLLRNCYAYGSEFDLVPILPGLTQEDAARYWVRQKLVTLNLTARGRERWDTRNLPLKSLAIAKKCPNFCQGTSPLSEQKYKIHATFKVGKVPPSTDRRDKNCVISAVLCACAQPGFFNAIVPQPTIMVRKFVNSPHKGEGMDQVPCILR